MLCRCLDQIGARFPGPILFGEIVASRHFGFAGSPVNPSWLSPQHVCFLLFYLLACLLACLLAGWLAGLLACLLACLLARGCKLANDLLGNLLG